MPLWPKPEQAEASDLRPSVTNARLWSTQPWSFIHIDRFLADQKLVRQGTLSPEPSQGADRGVSLAVSPA